MKNTKQQPNVCCRIEKEIKKAIDIHIAEQRLTLQDYIKKLVIRDLEQEIQINRESCLAQYMQELEEKQEEHIYTNQEEEEFEG